MYGFIFVEFSLFYILFLSTNLACRCLHIFPLSHTSPPPPPPLSLSLSLSRWGGKPVTFRCYPREGSEASGWVAELISATLDHRQLPEID